MGKNLKIKIKNTQMAKALKLGGLKDKISKKGKPEGKKSTSAKKAETEAAVEETEIQEKPQRVIRARSKSAFDASEEGAETELQDEEELNEASEEEAAEETVVEEETPVEEAVVEEEAPAPEEVQEEPAPLPEEVQAEEPAPVEEAPAEVEEAKVEEAVKEEEPKAEEPPPPPKPKPKPKVKLGPTGRHVRDLLPPKPKPLNEEEKKAKAKEKSSDAKGKEGTAKKTTSDTASKGAQTTVARGGEAGRKEYRDLRPKKKLSEPGSFDSRDKQGLRVGDEGRSWRKRRQKKQRPASEEIAPVRPSELSVRLPIAIKDLAAEMKLKASQLIAKLFMQGLVVTLNDALDDETTVQLLGEEFDCKISIDTTEEERIRITDKTIREEIANVDPDQLALRPPVITFMGHVDHGKTSLIDAIRASNVADGEAGAITQHIGAFRCTTPVGDLTILDTPGHEAFSAMRARGADMTDIVVLVVAGDEGLRAQTIEAIEHAKAAGVTIVVAINKSDKPNFDAERVYRELADQELLPESWGGQTITVNCSAVSKDGITALLEMLALQAEVLELQADPSSRARGTVVESEMHRGMGNVATILVQNGTLRKGDCLVFSKHWGRVKTMRDELGREVLEAGPSTPVEVTGISGLPEAGEEFIVVESEKDAKEIAAAREEELRQTRMQKRTVTLESLLQEASDSEKKVLNLIIRADVQGSVEALKTALMKIESDKVDLNIISAAVGQISESDITLAAASQALILGFGTDIESHAEPLIKETGVQVHIHNIIYHAVDEVKALMKARLDKVAKEEERGKLKVLAVFKASQLGKIAGCLVTEGSIHRNHKVRIVREGETVWTGNVSSLKRLKEDVREVQKGLECGVLLDGFNNIEVDDIIEAFEIVYIAQDL